MGIVLKNNAHTVLSANVSSLDTTIYVSDVSSFPALGVGEYFYCTIESTTGAYEIVKVTQVNAASFDVVRAQENTIAVPFNIGARVELRVTVQALEDQFNDQVSVATEAAIAAAIGVTIQGYDADTAKLDLAQSWTLLQTFLTTPVVPDEAYSSSWDGVLQVPTKNAIYDKINTIDTTLSALDQAIVLKGTWDASSGSFPGGGIAQAGYSYIVSVGGTVDSTTFNVGDRIIAILDNASTSTYANNWFKADYTDAVSSVAGRTGAVTLQVADITDMSANGRSLVSAADYAAMRTLLGLGTSDAPTFDGLTIGATGLIVNATSVDLGRATANDPMAINILYGSGVGSGGQLVWKSAGTAKWRFVTGSTHTFSFQNQNTTNTIFSVDNTTDILNFNTAPTFTDAATTRTNLGLAIGTNVQAYDADLTTWAGVTPAAGITTFLATPSSANLISAVTDETGTGSLVFATSPTLVTPILGTPTSGTLTNCTGLPISTGVSGLAAGVATFLVTPSSVNLKTAVTDETGSGALVFATSPTLVTPVLGTPSSGTLTSCTGLPISTGVSGLGTGVATFLATPSSANLISAMTDETGTGALVFATSPTLVTPILGTPTSGTLTNCTGLPISTGVSGLGTGVATFLATPSSANLISAVTDETGTGSLVFGTSPTIGTPTINGGTSSSRIQLSSETTGTLTSASANKKILATGGITLPNSVFSAQDAIIIEGNGTARTITRGAGVTMYIAGTDSASGTLTANGVMGVHWRSASVCVLTGNIS